MIGNRRLSKVSIELIHRFLIEKSSFQQRFDCLIGEKKLKYTATDGQNGFIHSLNGNELVADADYHNPSPQHRRFEPTDDSPILACGVRPHHAIKQLLTMPLENTPNHCSFPLGRGLIHSIHGLGEFGLHKTQILIRSGIRQCKRDTDS
jgi:hypothetical protein